MCVRDGLEKRMSSIPKEMSSIIVRSIENWCKHEYININGNVYCGSFSLFLFSFFSFFKTSNCLLHYNSFSICVRRAASGVRGIHGIHGR